MTYQDALLASKEAPPHAVTLRARNNSRREAEEPNVVTTLGVRPNLLGAQGNAVAVLGPKHQDIRPKAGKPTAQRPSPHHPWRKPPMVTKSQNC